MPRKKWPKRLVNEVFDKTLFSTKYSNSSNNYCKISKFDTAYCWHCGKTIVRGKRTAKDGQQAWHIDHYPVQFVDIENQICCGVTDQHDITNLVPSCVLCNVSHQYERKHCYYCGRSQCLCTKKCMIITSTILFILFLFFLFVFL
tara:strand:- start:19 stop:453 length:435 start_codon:yes stop_codon:yes gene_type:complete